MVRGLWFAGGVIFGVFLTCAACTQGSAFSSGPAAPPPEATGYYGPPPGPPPGSRTAISQAMNDLQHARYVLQARAALAGCGSVPFQFLCRDRASQNERPSRKMRTLTRAIGAASP